MMFNELFALLNKHGLDVDPFACAVIRSLKDKDLFEKMVNERILKRPLYKCEALLSLNDVYEAGLFIQEILDNAKIQSQPDLLSLIICLSSFDHFDKLEKIIKSFQNPYVLGDSLSIASTYMEKDKLILMMDKYVIDKLPKKDRLFAKALMIDQILTRFFTGKPFETTVRYAEEAWTLNSSKDFFKVVVGSGLGYAYKELGVQEKAYMFLNEAKKVIENDSKSLYVDLTLPLAAKNIYAYGDIHFAWRLLLKILKMVETSKETLVDLVRIVKASIGALHKLEHSETLNTVQEIYLDLSTLCNILSDSLLNLSRLNSFKDYESMINYLYKLYEIVGDPAFLSLTMRFAIKSSFSLFEKNFEYYLNSCKLGKTVNNDQNFDDFLKSLISMLGELFILNIKNKSLYSKILGFFETLEKSRFKENDKLLSIFITSAYMESIKEYPLKKRALLV